MVLLLGASGYVGHAFANELLRRRQAFVPLTRRALDYTSFNVLFDYLRRLGPDFVISAAGFTGRRNEQDCEQAREEALNANTVLPQTIAHACLLTQTPWGHVSSGNIYAGAKVVDNGRFRIEKDLHRADIRHLLADHPERILGFTELDEPNCSFRHLPCSFYSGSKALAEEAILQKGKCYSWRPGLVFNAREEPRNFLTKLQRASGLCDSINSLSQVDDFARACLDLWEARAPFGIYNVVNTGAVTTRHVVHMIQRILKPARPFSFRDDNRDAREPDGGEGHFHSVLDPRKLVSLGVQMRPVDAALEDALRNWTAAPPSVEMLFH